MKKMLLLAAGLLALTAVSTASAGERLQSPRAKDNQTPIVRAEARVLGGRADRSVILASPRQADQQYSNRKVKSPAGMKLGGRNSPK